MLRDQQTCVRRTGRATKRVRKDADFPISTVAKRTNADGFRRIGARSLANRTQSSNDRCYPKTRCNVNPRAAKHRAIVPTFMSFRIDSVNPARPVCRDSVSNTRLSGVSQATMFMRLSPAQSPKKNDGSTRASIHMLPFARKRCTGTPWIVAAAPTAAAVIAVAVTQTKGRRQSLASRPLRLNGCILGRVDFNAPALLPLTRIQSAESAMTLSFIFRIGKAARHNPKICSPLLSMIMLPSSPGSRLLCAA